MCHMCAVSVEAKEGIGSIETVISDSCKLPCECCELNLGPLEEPPILLTNELSLQSMISSVCLSVHLCILRGVLCMSGWPRTCYVAEDLWTPDSPAFTSWVLRYRHTPSYPVWCGSLYGSHNFMHCTQTLDQLSCMPDPHCVCSSSPEGPLVPCGDRGCWNPPKCSRNDWVLNSLCPWEPQSRDECAIPQQTNLEPVEFSHDGEMKGTFSSVTKRF